MQVNNQYRNIIIYTVSKIVMLILIRAAIGRAYARALEGSKQ